MKTTIKTKKLRVSINGKVDDIERIIQSLGLSKHQIINTDKYGVIGNDIGLDTDYSADICVDNCSLSKNTKLTPLDISIEKISAKKVMINNCSWVNLTIPDDAPKGRDYIVYGDELTDTFHLADANDTNIDPAHVLGGFHYGLITEDEKPTGNKTEEDIKAIAGINVYSIWTNTHRPTCKPNGMVYIKELAIWVDIYLLSTSVEDHSCTSLSFGHIAAGGNYKGRKVLLKKDNFYFKDFKEVAETHNKRMLKKKEFEVAMYGVAENTSAKDLCDGTIKHIDFLTSKYGIEQATGTQWIWSSDLYEGNKEKGVILGGYRGSGVNSGSRCSSWSHCAWNSLWSIGCRFACDHLKLGE